MQDNDKILMFPKAASIRPEQAPEVVFGRLNEIKNEAIDEALGFFFPIWLQQLEQTGFKIEYQNDLVLIFSMLRAAMDRTMGLPNELHDLIDQIGPQYVEIMNSLDLEQDE